MKISGPNYRILFSVTGDNSIEYIVQTTSSSSFSAKSVAQVEKKNIEEK